MAVSAVNNHEQPPPMVPGQGIHVHPRRWGSRLERYLRARRDEQAITTRCTCGHAEYHGPAGEVRELMRAHRAEAHPERPLVAKAPPPEPKPKRPTRQEEARALASVIQPGKAARTRKPRKPTYGRASRFTDELLEELHHRYRQDPTLGTQPLLEGIWQTLGYANAESAAGVLRRQWHKRGMHLRPSGGYHGPRPDVAAKQSLLTTERIQAVRTLWAAGCRTWRIAGLAWEGWGYANQRSCGDGLTRLARTLPEHERPNLDRTGPRHWVGAIAPRDACELLGVAYGPAAQAEQAGMHGPTDTLTAQRHEAKMQRQRAYRRLKAQERKARGGKP